MENFDQIFILVAESNKIGLNTDILETGIINVIALIGILIYTGRDFLGSVLETRKTSIVEGIQDAENRLNEANKRLNEAQKQLDQANLVVNEIKNETLTSKKTLLESEAYESKKDLQIRFSRAQAALKSKERKIFLEVKEQIIVLVLNRIVNRVKETFNSNKQASNLINETIIKLQGDLL